MTADQLNSLDSLAASGGLGQETLMYGKLVSEQWKGPIANKR